MIYTSLNTKLSKLGRDIQNKFCIEIFLCWRNMKSLILNILNVACSAWKKYDKLCEFNKTYKLSCILSLVDENLNTPKKQE